jgi:Fic family protein
MYIHERPDWPRFTFRSDQLLAPLAKARAKQGLLQGQLEGLGVSGQDEARVVAIASEAMTSSEIEGERLDFEQVRSSVARRLGIEQGGLPLGDHRTEGVVEMTLDAAQNWQEPLTRERLFRWQAGLFPGGYGPLGPVKTGGWRTDKKGPMQVVSGAIGHERVHFEAPAAERLDNEMRLFLRWYESDVPLDWVVKAGIAHLWFETIHPFDDGNGRVGRAVLDLALARADEGRIRCYSVSTQLRKERTAYYDQLEQAQKETLDATDWLAWFIDCFGRAIETSSNTIAGALQRSKFWIKHSDKVLNQRQREVLSRMLMRWEGKMTVSKWAKMKKVADKTAQRDLIELFEMGILAREGSGRGTGYVLAPLDP